MRAGIILVLPFAVLADRIGRRRVVIAMAVAAPLVTAAGALAPTFPVLVATQAIGRPLGLALDFLVAVVAAEEMPRNSRAYAVSVLAMASGLGAGVAVMALPLADISADSWRLVYLVALVWLVVAVDIARRLPETKRFERPHVDRAAARPAALRRARRSSPCSTNLFVAPASLFQNGYLEDVRGFSATTIAIFTLATATPAGIGLILGGRLADVGGRRRVIAAALPAATAFGVLSYSVGGPLMWLSVFLVGVLGGITYPALAVYRTELFPTGNRSRAAGLLTATALLGGIGGLLVMGTLLDRDWTHGRVMALLASAQVLVVVVVLLWYPETAHRELEDINPEDRLTSRVTTGASGPRLSCLGQRAVVSAPPMTASAAVRPGMRARVPTSERADVAAPRAWRQRGSIAARSRRWLAGLRTEGRRVGRPVAVDRRGGAGPRRRRLPGPIGPGRARGHAQDARDRPGHPGGRPRPTSSASSARSP